jgi:alkanesulfonate monooxygenase SsuD/methylene tetrahydromethanopterin reductase-like flavin-dependent oxidoreductase (luciferase family)
MKLGLVLEQSPGEPALVSLARQASACEAAGIDAAWLGPPGEDLVEATATSAAAAALAPVTETVRLIVSIQVGPHPLRIAEEVAVADNCTGGRLVVVLGGTDGRLDLLDESADVLLAASAPRPFLHHGPRWQIPARRAENEGVEQRLRMMPPPAQIELPVWLSGPGAAAIARLRGLSHVSTADESPGAAAQAWSATESRLGAIAARLRRPAIRRLEAGADGDFDAEAIVAALRTERELWGLDVAVIRVPVSLGDSARERAIDKLARQVRPRLQLDVLPPGLEAHWKRTIDERELAL